MPRNKESNDRKEHIVVLLEQRLGPLSLLDPRRSDWYSAMGSRVDIFITDSKGDYGQRPWFDMHKDDLETLSAHQAGFIVFLLGSDERYLVIPARDLVAALSDHTEGPTVQGFYHFNTVIGRKSFSQLPNWDYSSYVNNLGLLPERVFPYA